MNKSLLATGWVAISMSVLGMDGAGSLEDRGSVHQQGMREVSSVREQYDTGRISEDLVNIFSKLGLEDREKLVRILTLSDEEKSVGIDSAVSQVVRENDLLSEILRILGSFEDKESEYWKKMLNEHGLDKINSLDEDGDTLLTYSVYKKNSELVKLLQRVPNIDVNLENKRGNGPIHCLCKVVRSQGSGDEVSKIMETLINDDRVDVCKLGEDGFSPLYMLVDHGFNSRLMAQGVNDPAKLMLGLFQKRQKRQIEKVKSLFLILRKRLLSSNEALPRSEDKNLFGFFKEPDNSRELSLVEYAVNQKAGDGTVPLTIAAFHKNTDIIKTLLGYGAVITDELMKDVLEMRNEEIFNFLDDLRS